MASAAAGVPDGAAAAGAGGDDAGAAAGAAGASGAVVDDALLAMARKLLVKGITAYDLYTDSDDEVDLLALPELLWLDGPLATPAGVRVVAAEARRLDEEAGGKAGSLLSQGRFRGVAVQATHSDGLYDDGLDATGLVEALLVGRDALAAGWGSEGWQWPQATLEELNLSACALSVPALVPGLTPISCAHLERLSLGGNTGLVQHPEQAEALGKALSSLPRLRVLDVRNVGMAEAAGVAFVRALASSHLEELNLSDNELGLEVGSALIEVLTPPSAGSSGAPSSSSSSSPASASASASSPSSGLWGSLLALRAEKNYSRLNVQQFGRALPSLLKANTTLQEVYVTLAIGDNDDDDLYGPAVASDDEPPFWKPIADVVEETNHQIKELVLGYWVQQYFSSPEESKQRERLDELLLRNAQLGRGRRIKRAE